jgi:hypothetical protein
VCHYDGHLYESGALILLPENKYMSDAAREYGELWMLVGSPNLSMAIGHLRMTTPRCCLPATITGLDWTGKDHL